ncbi:MAG: hypothetical protein DDT32_01626 [Syntrophomonadaceae bacterium]|nr:hypothetical protein [Bacillota bacterium]MBT9147860.1 hypothetical protein [Bacillota bacterium]
MRKRLVVTALLILGLCLFTYPMLVGADNPDAWFVSPDGNDITGQGTEISPWRTIQHAINEAASGDTIRVAQGTYRELLSITKTLTLEGGWDSSFMMRSADATLTVIDAGGAGNVIAITVVANSDINVTIDGFTITNGQAFDGAGVHVEADGSGLSAHVCLKNNIITANYADWGGGASGAARNAATVILELNDNTISHNRATRLGGGIAFNAATSGAVTIISNNNTISHNTGDGGGGGIYLNPVGSGSSLNFTSNNDVINNNKTAWGFAGGGIATYSTAGAILNIDIYNSTINENWTSRGGGIAIQSDGLIMNATISNSDISGNRSPGYGGGLFIMDRSSNFALSLSGNTISYNRIGSGGYEKGGGIYFSTSSATPFFDLYQNTISGNSALGFGGGIYVANSSPNLTMVLEKNKILSNETDNRGGGGIFINNSVSMSLEMTNNIIALNKSEYELIYENYGGGINITNLGSINVTSVNNTITANVADDGGGGIFVTGTAELSLVNDIVFHNTGPRGADIWNYKNTASISIAYSNIGKMFGRYINAGGNINADPMFANPLEGDFRLTTGSPCIDAGTSDGAPTTDFEGDRRPQGRGYDMGADEYFIGDALPGDATGDGRVDVLDLSAVAEAFNTSAGDAGWNPEADLNQDGIVDIFDLVKVGRSFGKLVIGD